MATNRRRAGTQPTETNLVKKQKTCQNDVVLDLKDLKVEEMVALRDEICEVEVKGEVGLLPWWPSEMIDEQMSWSMVWIPNWDAEFMGRAYHLLYADVAWDDDIWGLQSIHQIPTSHNSI